MTTKELRDEMLKNGLVDSFRVIKVNDAFQNITDSMGNPGVIVTTVATHSDFPINNRLYPKKYMKAGAQSWLFPFNRPLLLNHNDMGDPIGRVIDARYVSHPNVVKADAPEYMKIGTGHLELKLKVTNRDAIEKVKDGTYVTGSVRFRTNHLWCSICKVDWLEDEPCEHWPGKKFDGETCYLMTGDMEYLEYSFVNIPADSYAQVLKVETDSAQDMQKDFKLDYYIVDPKYHWFNNSDNLQLEATMDKTKKEEKKEEAPVVQPTTDAAPVVNPELDALKAELATANTKIEELDAALAETASLKEKQTTLETANAALTSEKDALVAKVAELEKSVSDGSANLQKLTDDNARLLAEIHTNLAEKLADLRILKGRLTQSDRQNSVTEFVKRSAGSLKDAINDLLNEKTQNVLKVEDPTLSKDGKTDSTQKTRVASKVERLRAGLLGDSK